MSALSFQSFNLFPRSTVLEKYREGPVIVKGEPKAGRRAALGGTVSQSRVGR